MSEVVFDASAILAILHDEPGSKAIEPYLNRAVVSAVNLSEVIAQLIKQGMPEKLALSTVNSLGLRLVPFDDDLAYIAAVLIKTTSKAGLSLGDRACLALAQSLKVTVITADRAWGKLDLKLNIKLFR
jgi:ribonuclease VapC